MATKKLAVTDPNGNPILTPEEARERFGEAETGLPELGGMTPSQMMRPKAPAEPAAPRKKGGLPTVPADWRGPHTAVILGRVERSVGAMPVAIRQEQRAMLLAAFTRALDAGVA